MSNSSSIPPWLFAPKSSGDVVTVGAADYPVDPSRPPAVFLHKYVEVRLQEAWSRNQEDGSSHPLWGWWNDFDSFVNTFEKRGLGAEYKDILTAGSSAFLMLAFDMYSLDGNKKLQDSLIERLVHRTHFQGALHELSVGATAMRAGFDLAFEDEGDGRKKHPEFIATHKTTHIKIAVEAKSIHRVGVLGAKAGNPPPSLETASSHKIAAQICGQVEKALPKAQGLPLYVFVDLNLPPEVAEVHAPKLLTEFNAIIPQIDHGYDANGIRVGKIMNFLAITNRPMHIGESRHTGGAILNLFITPRADDCRFPDGSQHVESIKAALRNFGTATVG